MILLARSLPSMNLETMKQGNAGAADIVDGNNVGVIEIGDGAGFGQVGFGVFGAKTSWRWGTLMATGRCNWSSWAR